MAPRHYWVAGARGPRGAVPAHFKMEALGTLPANSFAVGRVAFLVAMRRHCSIGMLAVFHPARLILFFGRGAARPRAARGGPRLAVGSQPFACNGLPGDALRSIEGSLVPGHELAARWFRPLGQP